MRRRNWMGVGVRQGRRKNFFKINKKGRKKLSLGGENLQ